MLNQNLLLAGDDGYNLTNSLRFRASASANLSKTWGSNGSSQTFTTSAWVKRGALGSIQDIVTARQNGLNNLSFRFTASDTLEVYAFSGGSLVMNLITTQVFRDPSAWYHVVFAVDTTQATSTNRVKFYVNGAQITAFSTATYPSLSATTLWNQTAATHYFATYDGSSELFDGYKAEINVIDGQALTPSSFGSTNALTGVWQPARYTGTYGTNGFYLPFTDNSALTTSSNVGLGKDFSGNGNYWTTNNISITAGVTYDSMTDVPTLTSATTANYAVLNPVYKSASQPTISSGNLEVAPNAVTYQNAFSTIAITTGKWYCELLVTGTPNSANFIGISNQTQLNYLTQTANVIGATTGVGYSFYPANGDKYTNGTQTSYGTSVSSGDIVGIAVDLNNGKIWFSKNGTWQASGDPAAGTNAAFTGIASDLWNIGATVYSGGVTNFAFNFGQRPFSYTPPTGFVALNTFNLPNNTIVAGNKQMDATTYTGNGTAGRVITVPNINNVGFAWVKLRSGSDDHRLANTVTGGNRHLQSNTTAAESTSTNVIQAFSGNTFTVGSDNSVNVNGSTYVGWTWANGGAAVTNTAGTISAQVSANTTSGFSVVTYTGTAANATVGHGLGVAPSMIITKNRDSSTDWWVYHASLGNTKYLVLNTTAAEATSSSAWNNTSPTSTVFSLGAANPSNANQDVAYCWTPIAGYSAIGSYTGNGSTDGTFVYTGFRPKFVMIKRTDTSGTDWVLLDSSRDPTNVVDQYLAANLSDAESVYANDKVDFLSNGFKQRGTASGQNGSGGTFIYMAFAENPFKNSLAR